MTANRACKTIPVQAWTDPRPPEAEAPRMSRQLARGVGTTTQHVPLGNVLTIYLHLSLLFVQNVPSCN